MFQRNIRRLQYVYAKFAFRDIFEKPFSDVNILSDLSPIIGQYDWAQMIAWLMSYYEAEIVRF